MRDDDTPVPAAYTPPQGCLLRLFWMALGNLALLGAAAFIGRRGAFSFLDAIYWLVVIALGAARYFDVVRFHGQTIEGEAATRDDLRRYLVRLLVLAIVLWAVAHVPQAIG